MGVITKTFTVQEVIDAANTDGLDHLRGKWLRTFDGKITGGCVLEQTAINMGVLATAEDIGKLLGLGVNIPNPGYDAESSLIMELDKFKVDPSSKWFLGESTRAGATIVYWNDRYGPTGTGYALATYQEVSDMVRDVLGPYAEEEFTLRVIDYSFVLPKNAPKQKVPVPA